MLDRVSIPDLFYTAFGLMRDWTYSERKVSNLARKILVVALFTTAGALFIGWLWGKVKINPSVGSSPLPPSLTPPPSSPTNSGSALPSTFTPSDTFGKLSPYLPEVTKPYSSHFIYRYNALLDNMRGSDRDELIDEIKKNERVAQGCEEEAYALRVLLFLKENSIDEHHRGLLTPEWRYVYNHELRTIEVPTDGNCLYHASCAILNLIKPDFDYRADRLRQDVSSWLEQTYQKAEKKGIKAQDPECNNPNILDYLDASIESFQSVRKSSLEGELESLQEQEIMGEDSQQINDARNKIKEELQNLRDLTRERYVALCKEAGFHGGPAEIYAISQLCQARIEIDRLFVVYKDGLVVSSVRRNGYDRSYGSEFSTTITLVNVGGSHYDAHFQLIN